MILTKPITAWAVVSLVSSVLGWLAGLPLLFVDYDHLVGATAGVGVVYPFLLGLLSATLGLLGVIFGLIALARIRGGEQSGRGLSSAGIILGALLLTAYVAFSARYLVAW